jgi:hypothetical protein
MPFIAKHAISGKSKNAAISFVPIALIGPLTLKIWITMDKKMRKQVGKPLKKAEKLVIKAERNNAKLADYDEKKRDPIIAKAKKAGIR